MLGDPQEALAAHRDCVCPPGPATPENASCSRVDTRPAHGSDDTRGPGSGKFSALCQAALRKRTHAHAMDQGLSLEQAHLCTPLCLFFFSVANIFWNPDLRCVYFPCLTGVLFLFISEVFVRLRQIRTYPHFSVRFLACFVAFELCVFLYILDRNPYWT